MAVAERTKDSVFRIPQRVKNGIGILVATATAAGCTPRPIQPTTGSTELPGSPTPTHIETVPAIPSTPSPDQFQPTATDAGVWELAEKPAAKDVWQVSPDGHIAYNEAQLYGGLFTIDKAHPENTQKYWEGLVRGLWNLNSVGKNTAFLAQFPTADALVKYLNNGGGPVNNLRIPVIYPSAKGQFYYGAALVPAGELIDLSQIAVAIYKPTLTEIYHYSPSPATGTEYISYIGAKGEVKVEVEKSPIGGKNILKFTLRKDLLADSSGKFRDGSMGTFLAMTDQKSPQENLLAATQLLNSWLVQMQTNNNTDVGRVYFDEWNPPLLQFEPLGASATVLKSITTLDGTPLAIR